MAELDPEQAARFARLAQRRGAPAAASATSATGDPAPGPAVQQAAPPVTPSSSAGAPRPIKIVNTAPARPAGPPAWAPPVQYKPVRYTQPIAITVARAAEAAAMTAFAPTSSVPVITADTPTPGGTPIGTRAPATSTAFAPIVGASTAGAATATAEVPLIDKHTNLAVTRNRRRHAAAAGRVIATGLATSGFFGTITALAQSDAHHDAASTSAPDSSVVVRTVEKTIYVDENGNPVAPPSSVPGTVDPASTAPGSIAAAVPGAAPVPVAAAPGAPAPKPGTPAPTPTPPPVTHPKAGAAPAPTPAPTTTPTPTPTTTPTTTTAPTTAPPPAPVTTQPPPATTQPPAPTTTKPPACTGSKCP